MTSFLVHQLLTSFQISPIQIRDTAEVNLFLDCFPGVINLEVLPLNPKHPLAVLRVSFSAAPRHGHAVNTLQSFDSPLRFVQRIITSTDSCVVSLVPNTWCIPFHELPTNNFVPSMMSRTRSLYPLTDLHTHSKKNRCVFGIKLDCVWWWGSSVEYSLIVITIRFTLARRCFNCKNSSSWLNKCLKIICIREYPVKKKPKLLRNSNSKNMNPLNNWSFQDTVNYNIVTCRKNRKQKKSILFMK